LQLNNIPWKRFRASRAKAGQMKLFYTGPEINAELLLVMLEKHGIRGRQEWADPSAPDDGDLSRQTQVFVEDAEFDRARELFFTEREDEL
jgi:hypothetical protein